MAAPARILIVDDEAHVREFITILLEARDYTVESVASGHEALAQIEAFTFDLVISDLIGISYGLLFQRQSYDIGSALGWGVSYGFFWWIFG